MSKLKQWLGWIIFCGIMPSAALLLLVRYMRQHEVRYYLVGVPPLLLYFSLLGRLGFGIPGVVRKGNPQDVVYNYLGFKITAEQALGKVLGWLRAIAILFVMPALGAGLLFYGVRDGEIAGYFLGPCLIWVSGGIWALLVQFSERCRERTRS